jgi:hypothetical protein
MQVFISHSMKDAGLTGQVDRIARNLAITPIIAEHYLNVQGGITAKVESGIRASDVVLVLLTPQGFNSDFVQQEIAFAASLGKPKVLLVQKGLEEQLSGWAYGHDFISYDPSNPRPALNRVFSVLTAMKQKKEQEQALAGFILAGLGLWFLLDSGNKE